METWDFLKPSVWICQFTMFGMCQSDITYNAVCVCVTIGTTRNRQLPWKQSVVDIGFNSVHYQVRPTKITITAERFYENRHGNRQAHGYGA